MNFEMGKFKSLVSDTLIFAIGNFTVKILYFILMPIYTASLSSEEFGLADLLNNTLQLVVPILTLSISDAVFRFMLEKNADKNIMIIVKGPKEAVQLVKELPEVTEINYGGVAKKNGSKAYGKAIFLNEEELASTKELISMGKKIIIQMVPTSPIERANFE